MHTLLQDLRYGFRMLRKSPGFTTVAVLTLALGIGVNTAIFSVISAVLLRPLPVRDPDRIVALHLQLPKLNLNRTQISGPDYTEFSGRTDLFEASAALSGRNFNLTGHGQPQRVAAMRATASLFPLLGVQPLVGRTFSDSEDTYGGPRVALLSQTMWQKLYGGSSAIGTTLELDGRSFEIIGILPAKLEAVYPKAELWIPMAFLPEERTAQGRLMYSMVARLRASVSLEQARAAMAAEAAHKIQQNRMGLGSYGIEVRPLAEEQVGEVREPLYILLGAVALVLLIACANISNLLLARSGGRAREVAIRAAIGADRRRIVTQLLTESLLLAIFGGALGLLLGEWGITALLRLAPASLPHADAIRLDLGVLGFTVAVCLLAGILFGLAPALHASRANLSDALKETARTTAGPKGHGLRQALTISQVALAMTLLICSGLLLRSLVKLLEVNPGFDPTNVLTARLSLPRAKYPNTAGVVAFSNIVLARVAALPGVTHAALANQPPLFPDADSSMFVIPDYHPGPNDPQPHADVVYTTADYFAAMRIPLLQGRVFTQDEVQTAGQISPGSVVVIDEALAKRFWHGQSAVGKQLGWSEQGPFATIAGVVGTVRNADLVAESKGTIYFPYCLSGMTLVVRTSSDPMLLVNPIREQVMAVDSDQPVYEVKTMSERVAASVERRRFAASLFGLFAALALVLAIIGLQGVVGYLVTQRTHEIGVRIALGAARTDVLRMVLQQGLTLALAGVAAGFAGAVLATRLLSHQLFGVRAMDLPTFLGVAALLTAAALFASYIPARRAAKVDPMVALRYE